MWIAIKDFTQRGIRYTTGQELTEADVSYERLIELEAIGRVQYEPVVKPIHTSNIWPEWEALHGDSENKPDTGV